MTKYIQHIPKPLLEDIINNQCIPIIGAGFSMNCDLPKGKSMPLWDDLGKKFAEDLTDYPYSNALDAISAYSFEYSRSKLVEKLSKLLFVSEARPSNVHQSFCNIPFDTVCTTNFDFLLEKGYESTGKYCLPIIDEEQLAINSNQHINQDKSVFLLKLHGDLHHPNRMIATEQDYDSFLEKYPLMSTYLANLLITRTPLFIGYSLEDADFRQVWQIISNRLGDLRRPAYVISVGAKQAAINRYKRRGVNVINFSAKSYRELFEVLFKEIRDYWIKNIPSNSNAFDEQTLAELSLPIDATNRLCYVSVPNRNVSFYKSYVFPLIESYGFSPVSSDELVMAGDNIVATETSLLERADMIIFDAEDRKSQNEIRNILEKRSKPLHLLVIVPRLTKSFETRLNETHTIRFIDKELYEERLQSDEFLYRLEDWLNGSSELIRAELNNEPARLLRKQEYKAAVVSAFTLLESELNKLLSTNEMNNYTFKKNSIGHLPLIKLFNIAIEKGLLGERSIDDVRKWLTRRNKLVHGHEETITPREASKVVRGVNVLINNVKQAASSKEN
ncbi:SIR2 family protein [Priestia aryabhattai]|uniref:SIR2 family NAD-dependent protein deacylase n=1 Tax=Priestia aryabhattai TaxID=412384 RepID=UPI00366EE067